MIILVIGGAGSGKSEYAEMLAQTKRKEDGRLIYCATMHCSQHDREGIERIARHQRLRAGKGFLTIEQETGIGEMEILPDDTMLLEDLTNLLANEMYLKEGALSEPEFSREKSAGTNTGQKLSLREDLLESAILDPLFRISDAGASVIVVANDVFRDGRHYDAETELFLSRLAYLHRRISGKAEQVTEVVYGIPVGVKGGRS
ncbi:MAG: bifunctional adenosylcobinamide kinase/adenosylcobinamide-phosphate guanylyltransferase [Lachnospiraceae bacterium]|nr:bifunctional adenosylcobinamide kinase/adenosylcobinamide-phosphate guanylyltransferase [Lachnospiraceae bacterium]